MPDWIVLRIGRAVKQIGTLASTLSNMPNDQHTGDIAVEVEKVDSAVEIAELRADPGVLALAPDVPLTLVAPTPSKDSEVQFAVESGQSWGVHDCAKDADATAGSTVKVAILDTGIDQEHPAFSGVDFTTENFSASHSKFDLNGHGTHCAGTILGRDVDGVRIGVARGISKVFSGKVVDDDGSGSSRSMALAIEAAHKWGANILSMSVGINFQRMFETLKDAGCHPSEALSRCLSEYRDTVRFFDTLTSLIARNSPISNSGMIFVAAAGNSSRRGDPEPYVSDVELPAAAIDVISVGSVGRTTAGYRIADHSCINPVLSAPGVDIVSARLGSGLVALSGTSMAAPHVAGLAALWWEATPSVRGQQKAQVVSANLLASCYRRSNPNILTGIDYGAGIPIAP